MPVMHPTGLLHCVHFVQIRAATLLPVRALPCVCTVLSHTHVPVCTQMQVMQGPCFWWIAQDWRSGHTRTHTETHTHTHTHAHTHTHTHTHTHKHTHTHTHTCMHACPHMRTHALRRCCMLLPMLLAKWSMATAHADKLIIQTSCRFA